MSKTNLDPAQVAQVIQAVLSALNETPSSVVDTVVREKPSELPTPMAGNFRPRKKQVRQKRNEDFPNASKPWTALEQRALIDLRDHGAFWTYEDIAQLLGRTTWAVRSQMVVLRDRSKTSVPNAGSGTKHRWNAELDAELLERKAAGHSWEEIGRRLQRTGDSCRHRWNLLNRSDAPARFQPPTNWTGLSVLNIPVDDVFGDQQAEAG